MLEGSWNFSPSRFTLISADRTAPFDPPPE